MVKAFLDHDGPIAFAHRGGALEVPENTMAAFSHAVELGYAYIETDVHVTADGVLLAFHDDVLDRVTDAAGVISELPYSRVRSARIDGEHEIPLFTDLLEAFPEVRINVDTKSDESVAALAETIVATKSIDRICVGSFEDERIQRLRAQLGHGLCTAAGPAEVRRLRVASFVPPTLGFRADCLQVPIFHGRHRLVDRRFVRAAHKRDLAVHVWTIDEPDDMHELLDLGVDGIMTDRPTELASVLRERDQWNPAG